MADILIRGMEMPKTCFDCPFFVVFYKKQMGICTAFGDGTNREKMSDRKKETGRMSGCPLHELPPHGDLIDRDALPQGRVEWEDIDDAPVVIPSNKEDTP